MLVSVVSKPRAADALRLGRRRFLAPERIDYLAKAGMLLGHLQPEKIRQLAESVASVRTPFAVLPAFQKLVAGNEGLGA